MRGAIQIATLRGIPIRVHYSFLLVLPFLAWLFGLAMAGGIGAERLRGHPLVWGAGLAVALFLSVLVHELAHSVYALRKGGEVSDITLLMIGGVSRITRMPEGARHEALMALAGPATSLVLGVLLRMSAVPLAAAGAEELAFAAAFLGGLNVFLGLFNLLPAFPMDGGRVVRALLTGWLGRVRATQAAAFIGKGFAVLFGLVGLFGVPGLWTPLNPFLLLIAFYVFMGAAGESREVLLQTLLSGLRVRELMTPRTSAVGAEDSLEEVDTRLRAERRRALPMVEDGRVVGLVTQEAVLRVPAPRRGQTLAREVALPVPELTPETQVWDALREMGLRQLPQLPVVQDGLLVGTLTQEDLVRGIQRRELEEKQRNGPWGVGPRESHT
ncbi:site-2 protease family protein [Archangium sp. Cb G35]|uniref:site-2 protease family protein n=1 Tax=Archangium sp. Cb G35 TaxID=1920190 RepID=UPI000A4D691A|nr:site-2 protease family protein [Archangium sp. Cb G35]